MTKRQTRRNRHYKKNQVPPVTSAPHQVTDAKPKKRHSVDLQKRIEKLFHTIDFVIVKTFLLILMIYKMWSVALTLVFAS